MSYNDKRHDIGITNVGTAGTGTAIEGMMLVQDKGVPIYEEFDDQYLAEQFFTGSPSFVNVPPERRLPISQSDWRSGYGQEYQSDSDPLRYYESFGCDLANKGMAIAGQTPTTVTKPTAIVPTLVNGDMELDANWLGQGGQSAAFAHGGTKSWLVWMQTTGNYDAYQDINVGWAAGVEYTVTVWGYHVEGSGSTSHMHVVLNDGVNETESTAMDIDTTWTQMTVTKTPAATATRLRVILRNTTDVYGGSGQTDAYFDDAVITTTGGTLTVGTTPRRGHATFNSEEYVAFGKLLAKLNAGGTKFDLIRSFPRTITCLEPFTDSKLYICQSTAYSYYEMNTSEVFTLNTLTDGQIGYMKTVHTTVDTMYGVAGTAHLRSTTNPANGGTQWSAITLVGDATNLIQDIDTKSGALYIWKYDMPYYLSSAGAVQNDLAPECAALRSTTSGQNTSIWLDKIYYPVGAQGLLEIGESNTWVSPAEFTTNSAAFVGRVQATAFDDQWLFAIVDYSGTIEVLKGRWETIDGTTSWVWHPISEITLTNCLTAWVSSIYQKRLWISSDTASEALYYIPLPTGYGNVTSDANKLFKTDTYFITPWYHGNFQSDLKHYVSMTAELGHAHDVNIYWECHYQIQGDTTWTDAGDFVGTATVRSGTLYIPDDSSSNPPTSKFIRFKFVAKTNTTATTPVLLSYNVTSILYPTPNKLIYCVVDASDNQSSQQGAYSNTATIKTTLDNARTATRPVSIRDIDGSTLTVKFLPLPKDTQRRKLKSYEKLGKRSWYYPILMQEVTTS